MATWKELGVVPDSDDESWGSHDGDGDDDDLQRPLSTANTPLNPTCPSGLEQPNYHVWDFPGSSPSPSPSPPITALILPQTTQNHDAEPQSAAPTSPESHASKLLAEQPSPAPLPDLRHNVDATNQDRESSHLLPDISVKSEACGDGPFRRSPLDLFGQHSAERHHEVNGRICAGTPDNATSADTPPPTASEAPVPGRRSLRPRKPIQEHPYLLENAQYSKAFKSHGLKPIRIAAVDQVAAKRRHEENSQDNEYTSDPSQSGAPDQESHEPPRTTTRRLLDDGLDELALSQSPRTSPPQRLLRASSEHSPGQHTDDTSVRDDEDFPDIRDLTTAKHTTTSVKRRAPPEASTSRKRVKARPAASKGNLSLETRADAWDLTRSPGSLSPIPRIRDLFSPDDSPRPSFRLRAISRSLSPAGGPDSPPGPQFIADPTDLTALTANSDEEQDSDESSVDSESDLIRRTGRKIRGVLPASWLRLDQQTRRDRIRTTMRRPSPPKSPDRPRQGLALTKAASFKRVVSTKSFLDALNEDDDEEVQRISEQAARDLSHEQDSGDGNIHDLDDNASLVEEDHIDRMLTGQKRNRIASGGHPRKRTKTQQNIFHGQKRHRQPKISESVHRVGRPLNSAPRSRPKERSYRRLDRAISPPALSIVDFMELGAPSFIKIAARAARNRVNMGRAKPLHKSINLGNRVDNLDAQVVLQRWKSGKIKQRSTTQQKPARPREPLRPVTLNTRRPGKQAAGLSFHQPTKMARQVSTAEFVSMGKDAVPSDRQSAGSMRIIRKVKPRARDQNLGSRPAQLEAEVLQGDDLVVFGARKKMLDLVLRRSRKEILAPTFRLRQSSPEEEFRTELAEASSGPAGIVQPLGKHGDPNTRKLTRSRKRNTPRRLDIDAPQYVHANDPLSFFEGSSASADEEVQPHGQEGKKITGLGPFGTHYSQNFDIFPLHCDTFFHSTNIIGNGTLKKALDCQNTEAITRDRPVLSFEFSNHQFQWGQWSGITSSELGLVFDAIEEDIEETRETGTSPGSSRAVAGADNVLRYVLEAVSVNNESELRFFTQRMSELLEGFISQTLHSATKHHSSQLLVQITSRFLICSLVILRLCQSSIELSNEAQQAEHMLGRLAKAVIEKLLEIGLSDLRTAYNDLQRHGIRERGIRADDITMTPWVVVMKVLQSAQVPRTGFWDLVTTIMAANTARFNDAQGLESMWRDMFSLLPLTEFDDAGILSQGLRHVLPLQGWALPQKLLKVVLASYQANERQSPSFNNYCLALLGRCHYLIEHWGWYKCVGVVATVFDFFGSQNLSNLRNEEVFESPQFLAKLNDGPRLSVEPRDSCFHIFLKMLAVAIRSMKRLALSTNIQNLILRCLPNHNRQYSKERTIHLRDLASLRNHHDLLCTMFWAAPADLRRPVELIEKLVLPASSHKEACLINLRAWNQLTRFVVFSGSSVQEYRPFMSWQNNVFQQVLNQYLSAATDVENQFMSMAKEDRSHYQRQFLDKIVADNQNAARDVLYFSVAASLDVVKHCPSLTAATFSFNVNQTTKVFSKFCIEGTDLDRRILRACFDTTDVLVKNIEDVWRNLRESSTDSVSTDATREVEDAIEFLDDKVMQSFTTAVRKLMNSSTHDAANQSVSTAIEKDVVLEEAIMLCGRIASLFIDGEKCSLLHFFSSGKYSLFRAFPGELNCAEWKYVPLFVATLLQNHVFNFSSIGCTHFDIWITCLVKPLHALRYGIKLAETLKMLDMGYMKGIGPITGIAHDYERNRNLFAHGISYMRRELRQAEFAQRKPTRVKYDKLLKAVMGQIRSDLKSFELNSQGHKHYISFVRDVVGLIKSHGSDICPVDPFFYQVSAEYSPPTEDPQMHTAGVLAYGIKLGEGETTAAPQLFFYLYNHFKISLSSGQLDAESRIIEKGMRDDNILAFVIGRMLPAIIRASSQCKEVWPLLGTYSKALQDVLARSCLPREIPEDSVDHVVVLLTVFLEWVRDLGESTTVLTASRAHVLTDLVGVCNAIRPSLSNWLQSRSDTTSRLRSCVSGITRMVTQAAGVLDQLRASGGSTIGLRDVPIKDLIRVERQHAPIAFDNHINSFTQNLIREVQHSWVVTADTVTVKVAATPSTQRGTQQPPGVNTDLLFRVGLLSELLGELNAWLSEMGEEDEGPNQRSRRRRPRSIPSTLAIDPF